jgi:hypothetical protein
LLWAFVAVAFAGFAAMLPISAGFVGTSMQTFNRLMIFQSWTCADDRLPCAGRRAAGDAYFAAVLVSILIT